jgi:hypothetical protein
MVVQQSVAPAAAMVVQQSVTPDSSKKKKSVAPAATMVVQQNVAPATTIVVKESTTTTPEHAPLHIDEPKASAYLGVTFISYSSLARSEYSDDERIEGWYLDTGARNHMNGHGDVIAKIDQTANSATVRLSKLRALARASSLAKIVNTRLSAASTTSHA